MLDATADPRILQAIFGEIEFHDIQVRRKAKVIQVWDRRMSKFSFLKDERRENHLAEVQIALSRLANRHRRGLIVTFKQVREHLVVPDRWAIEHFGAVRGLDQYKAFDAVVVVGTYLPPASAMEDAAAALFRGAELGLPGRYVDTDRGYVLRDGPAGVSVGAIPTRSSRPCSSSIGRLRCCRRLIASG